METRKWHNKYSIDCDIKYQSKATRKTYKYCVLKFLNRFKNELEPKAINTQKIKIWLLTFETTNTRKQMLCSINSFYSLTVGMPKKIKSIPYPKKEKSLPKIIDAEFLKECISKIENLKHKAIISIAFSGALRVSEVINLKIEDIDSKRMMIHIRNAKGKKDRFVKLSSGVLELLRTYFLEYNPIDYLFNGQFSAQYTASSCNKIVKKYIGQQYHFHLLRHASLTDMHENNTDIATLSKIAGHNSIITTMVYTHVSNKVLQNSYSPI